MQEEDFCKLLSKRVKGAGFLKTLLLKRVGSTIYAGMNTARSMLGTWETVEDEEEDEEEQLDGGRFKTLIELEITKLGGSCVNALNANQERDPKYEVIIDILINRGWLQKGCIIFWKYSILLVARISAF